MREVLFFPFQGMGDEIQTILRSLAYIVKMRIQLFWLVLKHIAKNGDEVSLAKDTWHARLRYRAKPAERVCYQCTEATSEMRIRLHKGAIHEITDRTRLRKALATMPLRNPDYLEQLSAEPTPPRDYSRDSTPKSKKNSAKAAREIHKRVGGQLHPDEAPSEALESPPKHPKV